MDAGYYEIDLSGLKFSKLNYSGDYQNTLAGIRVKFLGLGGVSDRITYKVRTVKEYLDLFDTGKVFRLRGTDKHLIFKTAKWWIDSEGNKFDVENYDLSIYDFEEL